ncbi:MAG: ribonuclease III [Lentisphaerae bacterium]|jgi:ribonuclease III|nr:ribonuclease III [Lentisphaerota bacterium]MBT4818358.1 ribonuclease III [Lentisphaerota bacterium]MBT5607915.1 ribonuclease III [Lentisphaerota bacterium]MBT7056565.1 ribonuclease III [Lentisphaerota bacterium]MBT7846356.1 ribonuclease III [Lentisphaerota bacterium]
MTRDQNTAELEQELGHTFVNPELLRRALTHPSFSAEQKSVQLDNQRLEFLGDAVLQLLTSDLLFERFPEMDEGHMTKVRSAVTKESALVAYALRLDLGRHLLLGKGEDRAGGRERPSNLGDAFESVLGALYLDGGLPPARSLCEHLLVDALEHPQALLADENPKGALQEWAQDQYQSTPEYNVVSVTGPEHQPKFTVVVVVDGREVAQATGTSRRNAERLAAEDALRELTGPE